MRSSVKSFEEKNSFEDFVAPARTVSGTTNVTQFLSRKLLTWGVEARGGCHISSSEPDRPDQTIMCGILRTAFARPSLDRYPSRCRRGQDGNAFH
jgi:hypothetical protein